MGGEREMTSSDVIPNSLAPNWQRGEMREDKGRNDDYKGKYIYTVEPRKNSLAFKGSPSIKVNILRSQMIVFNVFLPLFKGNPEIKVKNL